MGREIKRVPLDFNWPVGKIWQGFLNPHYDGHCQNCSCGGSGYTTARQRLDELVRLILLSGEDANRGKCHPYFSEMGSLYSTRGITPSPDMVELSTGLAGREPSFLGHDACDAWRASRAVIIAAGLPEDAWGICQNCKGEGSVWDSPENKEKAEAWESYEPPTGEAWQLWETVSEGSPCSPPCASPEELAKWLTTPGNYAGRIDSGTTYEQWLRFINGPGWAPSMIGTSAGIHPGAQVIAEQPQD